MRPAVLSVDDHALSTLVASRRGHFRLESGHHGSLWLDLDSLFADPARVRPFVRQLGQALRPHGVAAVCGPLVGGAFLALTLASDLALEFCYTERIVPPPGGGLYEVQYRLPEILHDRVRGKPVAIVDDAISAGSAVRGTHAALVACGAVPTVVGALLALGSAASSYFAEQRIPMLSVARLPYEIWAPADCPQCAAGTPLEDSPGVAYRGLGAAG